MNCLTCKVNKIGPKNSPFGGYLCSNEHLQCHVCNNMQHGLCGVCHESTKFVQMNFETSGLNTAPTRAPIHPHTQSPIVSLQSSCVSGGHSKNRFNENHASRLVVMENEAATNEIRKMETLYEGCPLQMEPSTSFDNHSLETVKLAAAKTRSTLQRSSTTPLIYLSSSISRQQNFHATTTTTTTSSEENRPECVFSKKLLNDLETQSQLAEEQLSMKDSKESLSPNDNEGVQNSMKTLYLGDPMPNGYSLSFMGNSYKNCTNISELSNTGTRQSSGQSTKASGTKRETIFTFAEVSLEQNFQVKDL